MMFEHGKATRGTLLRAIMATAFAGFLALGAGAAVAQDATPPEEDVTAGVDASIVNVDGEEIGTANFTPFENDVAISVTVIGLEPGEHGLHIADIGVCDPGGETPFESAGDLFNPTDALLEAGPQASDATPMTDSASTPASASPAPATTRAGDLGNITVGEDGSGTAVITSSLLTLESGAANSLGDADGTAIVILAGEGDTQSQPSDDSGERIGCGVIFPADVVVPVATPDA